MVKNKVVDATTKVVALIEPLAPDERARVIQAALTMLGDVATSAAIGSPAAAPPSVMAASAIAPLGAAPLMAVVPGGEKAYFDQKQPTNKGEELAVAARYREERLGASQSNKEELRQVVQAARRNFDAGNYRRDIENARVKGLFNRGGVDAVLSHYGQSVVDALPNRAAVKAIKKPKRTSAGRAPAKKRTARKPAAK